MTRAALFHCQFGVVQPSRGDSLHKVGAYNAACKLSGPDGSFDFTRKVNEYAGGCIMAPTDAPPAFTADRSALLSAMLTAETRRDGQPARLVELAIPREVPPERRLEFVRAVVQQWVDEGAVAVVDLHCPRAADGGEQPHAHVVLSRRVLGASGFGAKKLSNDPWTANKGRDMRAQVANRMNRWLAEHGVDVRVDHRSAAERGDPTPSERNVSRAAVEAWKNSPDTADTFPSVIAARQTRRQLRAARHAAAHASVEVVALSQEHQRRALTVRPRRRSQASGPPWVEAGGPIAAVSRRAGAVALRLTDGAVVIERVDAIRLRSGAVTDAALAMMAERAVAAGWKEVSLTGVNGVARDLLAGALVARGIAVTGELHPPSVAATRAAERYLAAQRQPAAAPAKSSPSAAPAPAAAPPRQASPKPVPPPIRQPLPPQPAPRRAPSAAPPPTAEVSAPAAPASAYLPPWVRAPGRATGKK